MWTVDDFENRLQWYRLTSQERLAYGQLLLQRGMVFDYKLAAEMLQAGLKPAA